MPQPNTGDIANHDAERSALSTGLVFPDYAMPIITVLDPQDFHDPWNREIYKAMRDAWDQDRDLSLIVLGDMLRNRGAQDGMIHYLDDTFLFEASSMQAQSFVDIVKDRSRRRKILAGLSPIARDLYDTECPIERVIDEGVTLLQGEIPPERGGATAEQGAVSVLSKAHYFYSNKIGPFETRGIPTGYHGLNSALDGWKRGYVYYVLGLEHSGKTTFALNCGMQVCKNGGRVVVFSLEQSVDASEDPQRASLWERVVLSQANVTTRTYQTGDLSDWQYQSLLSAGERVSQWDLTMYDDLRTIPEMEAAVQRLGSDRPVDFVVIDYLKLIEQNERFGTRNEEIGGLTRKLKRMALRLGVPIMVPHQVSSKAIAARKEKRIALSDAYESGHLSQDADVVLGLNRDELFNEETEKPNIIDLDILKDRISGGTGLGVQLFFNKKVGVIGNVYTGQNAQGSPPPDPEEEYLMRESA